MCNPGHLTPVLQNWVIFPAKNLLLPYVFWLGNDLVISKHLHVVEILWDSCL